MPGREGVRDSHVPASPVCSCPIRDVDHTCCTKPCEKYKYICNAMGTTLGCKRTQGFLKEDTFNMGSLTNSSPKPCEHTVYAMRTNHLQ